MLKLKPCPFCGGIAKLNAPGYEYYSPCWCKCTQCGAEGPTKLDELEAEKGWNERVQDDVEPRVMTLEEVKLLDSDYYYLESMRSPGKELREIVGAYGLTCVTWPSITWARQTMGDSGYGMTWRCWTSRPTDEQREATAWN